MVIVQPDKMAWDKESEPLDVPKRLDLLDAPSAGPKVSDASGGW